MVETYGHKHHSLLICLLGPILDDWALAWLIVENLPHQDRILRSQQCSRPECCGGPQIPVFNALEATHVEDRLSLDRFVESELWEYKWSSPWAFIFGRRPNFPLLEAFRKLSLVTRREYLWHRRIQRGQGVDPNLSSYFREHKEVLDLETRTLHCTECQRAGFELSAPLTAEAYARDQCVRAQWLALRRERVYAGVGDRNYLPLVLPTRPRLLILSFIEFSAYLQVEFRLPAAISRMVEQYRRIPIRTLVPYPCALCTCIDDDPCEPCLESVVHSE